MNDRDAQWPRLPLDEWSDTAATLHLWTQIAGKIRLSLSPWINHSWGSTLYVSAAGLTTSPIPYQSRTFDIEFDFNDHLLAIRTSDGGKGRVALRSEPVARFYRQLMEELAKLGITVEIDPIANELPETIPLDHDESHASYEPEYANRYWRLLVQSDRVLKEFRARFIGKCSPVHYFWGAPDLAVTRFSGRTAPIHPGGIPHLPDRVTREAYSHEVSSAGFWAGGGPIPHAAFYSYAYPEPEGFRDYRVEPPAAFYSDQLREFILPYDSVRTAPNPDDELLAFLQSTYEAAADLAGWDRQSLERPPGWHI